MKKMLRGAISFVCVLVFTVGLLNIQVSAELTAKFFMDAAAPRLSCPGDGQRWYKNTSPSYAFWGVGETTFSDINLNNRGRYAIDPAFKENLSVVEDATITNTMVIDSTLTGEDPAIIKRTLGIKGMGTFRLVVGSISEIYGNKSTVASVWVKLPSVDEGEKVYLHGISAAATSFAIDESFDTPILLTEGRAWIKPAGSAAYVPFTDEGTIEAGEWYRILRVTDVYDPENHLSQALVYDSAGTLIGNSEVYCSGTLNCADIVSYLYTVDGYPTEGEGVVQLYDVFARGRENTLRLFPYDGVSNKFLSLPGTSSTANRFIGHYFTNAKAHFASTSASIAPLINKPYHRYEARLRIPSGSSVNLRLFELINVPGFTLAYNNYGLVSVTDGGVFARKVTNGVITTPTSAVYDTEQVMTEEDENEPLILERDTWYTFRVDYKGTADNPDTPENEAESKADLYVYNGDGTILLGKVTDYDVIHYLGYPQGTTTIMCLGTMGASGEIHMDDFRLLSADKPGLWSQADSEDYKNAVKINTYTGKGTSPADISPEGVNIVFNDNFNSAEVGLPPLLEEWTKLYWYSGQPSNSANNLAIVNTDFNRQSSTSVAVPLKPGDLTFKAVYYVDINHSLHYKSSNPSFVPDSVNKSNIVLCEMYGYDSEGKLVLGDTVDESYYSVGLSEDHETITVSFSTLSPETTYALQFKRGLQVTGAEGIVFHPVAADDSVVYLLTTPEQQHIGIEVGEVKFLQADGETPIAGSTLSEGDKIMASATLTLGEDSEAIENPFTIILAVYDNMRQLVGIASKTDSLSVPGEGDSFETPVIDLTGKQNGPFTAKAFIWKSWSSMVPYNDGVTLGE